MIEITNAEIDLFNSVDFETNLELLFVHFEKWRQNLMVKIPNENVMHLCGLILIDIYLVICLKFYLHLPPEVAAATAESLPHDILTEEITEWNRGCCVATR